MRRVFYAALTIITLLSCGCSSGNNGTTILNASGKHPSGWAVADTGGSHPGVFLSAPSSCYECHGKDLMGGISKVSCFSASRSGITCHPGGPSGHPAGWANPDVHGKAAKALSAGFRGFAHCQVCHGTDFSGGIAKKTCLNTAGCHGATIFSPHSPSPWRDINSTGARTHASTDISNAAVCAGCHLNGSNSSRKPSPAAPAGTPPDCFNNTLCHGVEGHATGWKAPNVHGPAAKAAAGGTGTTNPISSFASCTQCHGAKYDGGIAEQSCLNNAGCHGANVAAPHPGKPWLSTTTGLTHTSTDTENAAQCATCHTGGANSTRKPVQGAPVGITACFNNTLCHGIEGHDPGWSAPAQHGASAKQAPSPSSGFASCVKCHGSFFDNGTAPSCKNNIGCHGLLVAAPHPVKPWTSKVTGAVTHTNTDTGNALTCAVCHTGGANSRLKPPTPASGTAGCYNNTLCHFHQLPYAPPIVPATVHGGEAKKNLTVCQSCHGTPGTPLFNGGTASKACTSCHTFAMAHPTDWQGSSTYSHRTAGNINSACTLCHDVSQGRTPPLPSSASCFSTTFTNGLGQTRTCHANGPGKAAHIVPYNNHNATARANTTYCLGCHQIAQNTPPVGDPPGCMNCHLTSPQTNPNNCVSCHQKPPGGTVYPDITRSHPSHNSLNVPQNSTLTAQCDQCHQGLGLGTIDHLNRARLRSNTLLPNAVVFGTLAKNSSSPAAYNQTTGSCTSTYCHGYTLTGGTNKNPIWGQTNYLAASGCGTCHGYPPPPSHPTSTNCSGCHPHVNATNNGFIDPTKHINGTIEVTGGSGHAFPYSGALHRTAGAVRANCSGCHDTISVGGAYPVAPGTPPLCSGCHLNMTNFLGATPGCWDCHGANATDGRPNAVPGSFPNRRASHLRGDHASSANNCTTCHPFSSGSTSHGWSNRTKSTFAQVNPGLTWVPGSRSNSGTCATAGCHGIDKFPWYP